MKDYTRVMLFTGVFPAGSLLCGTKDGEYPEVDANTCRNSTMRASVHSTPAPLRPGWGDPAGTEKR